MKLAVSNIAWTSENDTRVYHLMKKYGYSGLEIAPTRIFPKEPYQSLKEAELWSKKLKEEYDFCIPSMQSIWYGRQENLFGERKEQRLLIDYTKSAIDFAAAINCTNLVFGCPKNRYLPDGANSESAIGFFREIGDYAVTKGTVMSMEANPPIYHTNFINDTESAIKFIHQVDCAGFLLNLDVGTMIQNGESVSELKGNIHLIQHVHISEPGLRPIERREIHKELFNALKEENYEGYVSIEMGTLGDCAVIEEKLRYIREIFEDA